MPVPIFLTSFPICGTLTLTLEKTMPSASADSKLVASVERVGDELQLIRETLNKLRTDFESAMQNGRILFPDADPIGKESSGDLEQSRAEYETQPQREAVPPASTSLPEMPEPGNIF